MNLGRFFVGKTQRFDGTWNFEIMGLKELLQKQRGRIIGPECTHVLGDEKCGVDINSMKRIGTISSYNGSTGIVISGVDDLPANFSRGGYVRTISGRNAFAKLDVKEHSGGGSIELWTPPPFPFEIGQQIEVWPGCTKRAREDCHSRFNNIKRFGGFPHVPGSDRAFRQADVKPPETS